MKITKTKEFTINMGNYESLKFGASVEVDLDAFKEAPDPFEAAYKLADKQLAAGLADDIRKASELTGVGTSYIHTIDADLNA